MAQQVEVDDGGRILKLLDGSGQCRRFHAFWLRDNAGDAATRSPDNGQRLVTLSDIPANSEISSARLAEDILQLTFSGEEKTFDYSINWLESHSYDRPSIAEVGQPEADITTWDAQLKVPVANFGDLNDSSQALCEWLRQVRCYGFARINNGPVKSGALLQIAEWFGHVRKTNYGEYFEVRTEINPSNLAYTGLGLQAHTDNPYRDPVPTMQILYCLENSASGGESMVVDGYRACQRLLASDPEAFRLLSSYSARFEYTGSGGVHLTTRKPMIELSVDGRLQVVRFNNRSMAPVTDVPFELMEHYYAAYRLFSEIIDDPELAVSFKLSPGESFIVDNTRVLHARSAYSGAGSRWLQGCYPDIDGLLSKLAVLETAG